MSVSLNKIFRDLRGIFTIPKPGFGMDVLFLVGEVNRILRQGLKCWVFIHLFGCDVYTRDMNLANFATIFFFCRPSFGSINSVA